MSPIEIFGWLGSGAVVFSLLQSKMLRLRVINLVACLMVVGYSLLIGAWPMVAMNTSIALINAYYIVQIYREYRAQKSAAPADAVAETTPTGA
jgi:CHASE2 domain-containing sensor protein